MGQVTQILMCRFKKLSFGIIRLRYSIIELRLIFRAEEECSQSTNSVRNNSGSVVTANILYFSDRFADGLLLDWAQ
jgi:hypothetical protein